jgi:hypothetical protein
MNAPTIDGVVVPFSQLSVKVCTDLMGREENMDDSQKCLYLVKYISICAGLGGSKILDESLMSWSLEKLEQVVDHIRTCPHHAPGASASCSGGASASGGASSSGGASASGGASVDEMMDHRPAE